MKTLNRLYLIAKDVDLAHFQEALATFIKVRAQSTTRLG